MCLAPFGADFSQTHLVTLLERQHFSASKQGDQMSLQKKSPKLQPKPFFAKLIV
jgi:hypothetical protein